MSLKRSKINPGRLVRLLSLFVFTNLLCFTGLFAQAGNTLLLSSSPTGRYLLIEEFNSPNILVYDLQLKDTIARVPDNTKTFLGWENDTVFFLIKQVKGVSTLELMNVQDGKLTMVKELSTELLSVIKEHTYSVPSHNKESSPYLVYVGSNEVVYKYDFLSSSKEKIFNLNDFFNKNHIVDYMSVASNGNLLLNVQEGDKNGIYFFPVNGVKQIIPIDTSDNITSESYCFFFNNGEKCLYYRYHKEEGRTVKIDIVERNLSNMEYLSYQTLSKGVVPSLAIDIPIKKMFLVNCIVVDTNYSVSLDKSVFGGSSEVKEVFFEIIGAYIERLMNNFTAVPYNYNVYSFKITFKPNTSNVVSEEDASTVISGFVMEIEKSGYNKIIVIPNADYNEIAFNANQEEAFFLMKSRGETIKKILVDKGVEEHKIEIKLGEPVKGTTNTILQVW